MRLLALIGQGLPDRIFRHGFDAFFYRNMRAFFLMLRTSFIVLFLPEHGLQSRPHSTGMLVLHAALHLIDTSPNRSI